MMKKWNRAKILMAAFLAAGGVLGNQTTLYALEGEPIVYLGDEESGKQNSIVAPQKHSKEEILEFYKSHSYDLNKGATYQQTPSISPSYRAGKLSQETVTDGLNALNFVRYVAGIPSDVTIKEEYETKAQTGTVVMARNGKMEHQPENTYQIPTDFFEIGYAGTSQSNLGNGYTNISASIINGYMNDGDAGNIDRVGHRRWVLNPFMKETGFGYCNLNNQKFTALYAFDRSRTENIADYVAWPAEMMPYEIMQGPWSISLRKDKFTINEADVKVTLTNVKTQEKEIFDSTTNRVAGKTPYFNIDMANYGMGPAIIIKPSKTFSIGDQIQVEVTGLKDTSGKEVKIAYTVEFFSLNKTTTSTPANTVAAPESKLRQGTFTINKEVELECKTKGATIYYTTDGSEPTTSSKKYTSAIKVTGTKGKSDTTVIKAIAVKNGMENSAVSTFSYTIEIPSSSYRVVVNSGAGDGTYRAGSTVTVTADVPPVGKKFKNWIVEKGELVLANSKNATTTFTMPEGNVTIRAEYEENVIDPAATTYMVTVKNGTGSGSYAAGTVVEIKADKPASGKRFDSWSVVSGSAVFANENSEKTRFIMPAEPVTIEAMYKRGSSGSSSSSSSSSRPSGSGGPGSTSYILDSGILSSNAGKQFQKSNGRIAVSEWVKSGNTWYYAGADGMLKTGWIKTGGKWYYMSGSCAMTTGWQRVNERWYYLDAANGDMKSGWQKLNGKWYYLDPANGDMKSAWQFVNGKWYYLDPVNGDMKTDWQMVNGKWYYLDPVNGDMKTGWQQIRGKWYYMDTKNGDCLINTITPDGYRVDENGAWVY